MTGKRHPPKQGDFIADPDSRPSPAMQAVLRNLFFQRAPWGHLRGRSMHGAADATHKAMAARNWVTWPETALTDVGAGVAAACVGLDQVDGAELERLIQIHPCLALVELLRAERERRAMRPPATAVPVETLPTALPDDGLAHLRPLAAQAQQYWERSHAPATRRAYQADWRHFSAWCWAHDLAPAPDPATVALYLTACVTEPAPGRNAGLSVSTLSRRLSGLCWAFQDQGLAFDRDDSRLARVFRGIANQHKEDPLGKAPVLADDVLKMCDQLGRDLRGLRDRAILLMGFAGGLRRSEIVGLDLGRQQTDEGRGWPEFLPDAPGQPGGLILHVFGKGAKWREIEIGHGSSDQSCPIVALQTWIDLARLEHGPMFRRVSADGKQVLADRLAGQHVARLVKATALAAGIRGDVAEGARGMMFSGHSLRAGFGSSDLDERYVQKQFGHASVEMTRRYRRRRDRLRFNATKAAGL